MCNSLYIVTIQQLPSNKGNDVNEGKDLKGQPEPVQSITVKPWVWRFSCNGQCTSQRQHEEDVEQKVDPDRSYAATCSSKVKIDATYIVLWYSLCQP